MKVTVENNQVIVAAPYHPDFPPRARKLGGKWDAYKKVWKFDYRDEDRVRSLLVDIYGTDGRKVESVDFKLFLPDYLDQRELWVGDRQVLYRPSRDAEVRLGKGVILVKGGFTRSGGSRNHPEIGKTAGNVLEIRDMPASLIPKIAEHYEIEIIS